MEYMDTSLPTEKQFETLKRGYVTAQKYDLGSLNEILEKMQDERAYLESENLENSHPKLLKTLDNCIANLRGILEASNKESAMETHSHSLGNCATKTPISKLGDEPQEEQQPSTNDDTNLKGETAEPSQENGTQESAKDDNNGEAFDKQNSASSEPETPTKTQNRGRPFWQNPLAKIFSNFSLNLGKNNGRTTKKEANAPLAQSYPQNYKKSGNLYTSNLQASTQDQTGKGYGYTQIRQSVKPDNHQASRRSNQTIATDCGCAPSHSQEPYIWNGRPPIIPDCERRYPHNPPTPDCEPFPCPPPKPFPPSPRPPQGGCDPHKKLITNELDIIRLLLLYMALRPNCPHTYRICTLAQEHLEALGELVTTEP